MDKTYHDSQSLQDLQEYLRQGEPEERLRAGYWRTAIGLQEVDGLRPSPYLVEVARRHIEGELTIDEAGELLASYYRSRSIHTAPEEVRTEEADKVSQRITKLLQERTVRFTPQELMNIHRELFAEIYPHAGLLRDYNIEKSEWVLEGASVLYASARSLRETLAYDLEQEKAFSYAGLSPEQVVKHLARFAADLWQIHPFGEGNTRTIAVFFIKYLRSLGFEVENEPFAQHAWYFRNALVRASYTNLSKGIYETTEGLERFLENVLYGATHELSNRELHC